MSLITYDAAPAVAAVSGKTHNRKGFWRGLFDAMIESRMRRAEEEIRRHVHFLQLRELDQAGWKTGARSEDSLPFVR